MASKYLTVICTALFLIASIVTNGCIPSPSEPHEPPTPREIPTADVKEVATGGNAFAIDLYSHLGSTNKGNFFFSPYSISTALGMTYAGARGQTETEMAQVLHFTMPHDRLHASVGALRRDLDGDGKNRGYELSVANRLWGQEGMAWEKEFLGINEDHYGAGLKNVDFSNDDSRKMINDWVESQTNNRIKDLIKPGVIDSSTRLVLTNAIYFKGDWALQFDESNTHEADFHVTSDKSVKADLMFKNDDYRIAEHENLLVLELPYKGDDLSMLILLPKAVDGIEELESQLSTESIAAWTQQMSKEEVDVYLPKFKMTSEFRLKDALMALGMPSAFSASADFSGMTGAADLFISAVVHKAFVEVNEEGTEAAAATAVIMTESAAISNEFRADHPFLFLIRDNHTDAILFMGRVADPSAE